MKKNIYIQEIESLNRQISVFKLIDRHFKWNWWLVISLPISLFALSYIFFYFCYQNYYILCVLAVLFVITFIRIISYMDKKREYIIRQKYPYALSEGKYIHNRVIPEIQKQELIKLIDNQEALTKDNLLFLIESLKSKKDENKYSYTITLNSVIIVCSILCVLLSSYLSFLKIESVLITEIKAILSLLLISLITIIYIDSTIKDFILNRRKNKNRIIRTVENIYLEISNKKT